MGPCRWWNQLGHHVIKSIVAKGVVQIMENCPVDETARKFLFKQY